MRFSGTQRTVIDGPFAETRELVAGYWIGGCAPWMKPSNGRDVPQPHARRSDLEIRPIFEAGDFGAELTPELREQEQRLSSQLPDARH